ncbi:sensor histidine kinase [Streptomyces griseoviridis]|uniref:histidine kinase n=1 Tax=Streptomyces griseoviridis TaxID=45398 RepID=A0ABT9LFK3_STRGD|nr:ATP-binding protein [Streptomyces griseoviridis]MDP9682503.1 signal transduction histidine kinase [Streptomyces griseoviridis]GGS80946.1 histidine kinase [Streptomyces griseoviridis]
MTSATSSGERPAISGLLPVFLVTAVLAGLAVTGAVLVAPDSVRTPLGLGAGAAGLLLSVAVTVAAHGLRSARTARRRLESANQEVGRLLQERVRTAEEARQERARLTGELDRERARAAADLAQEHARLTDAHAAELARLTEEYGTREARLTEEHAAERARLTEEYEAERTRRVAEHTAERERLTGDVARLTRKLREAESRRAAAVSATANVAGRLQALATATLADLRAMEEKHADEEVLTDLLHLDHRTAQAGRLADSVAVLAGARSGRRWARPIAMESILRGAMGRISGYQRVRLHSTSDTAVAGHAAEAVMHALAEILDNAANFSPPTAEVHVYVEEVPAGAIVSVEDAGLVMGETQLRRAENAVSGRTAGLGGLTGTRLGLAVVGRLAQRYGLKVSFRPSARGGTGVLMLVPQDILVSPGALPGPGAEDGPEPAARTRTPAAVPAAAPVRQLPRRHETPSPARHPAPDAVARPAEPEPEHGPEPLSTLPHGLPKRRRGRTLAEAERTRQAPSATAPRTPPTREETKARVARFGTFQQAVRGTTGPPAADASTAGATTVGPTTTEPVSDPDPASASASAPASLPEGDTTT